jgi:ABC-type polysaccharide/polyol phosphate export permease
MFGVRVFGSIMSEYQTVEMAVITLVSVLLGDLKYEKYYEYNESIGTFYFCSYAIVIAIICFNIISAIINESYESVKSYLNDESQRYHITPDNEYVQRNFNFIIKLKLNYYEAEMRVVLEGKL